jgi:multidrug efflux pump subunit AcrA (membrane-fusion protein)
MTLPDLSSLRVVASLSDVDDGRLRPGMAARVLLDTYPDLGFRGVVVEVATLAAEVSPRSLRRAFRVRVSLDSVDAERMRPGMSVQLEVETAKLDDTLVAPRAAIDMAVDPPRAFLAGGGTRALRLGPCDALECVVEDGLSEGSLLRPAAPEPASRAQL